MRLRLMKFLAKRALAQKLSNHFDIVSLSAKGRPGLSRVAPSTQGRRKYRGLSGCHIGYDRLATSPIAVG
jgi:hypothetical protein